MEYQAENKTLLRFINADNIGLIYNSAHCTVVTMLLILYFVMFQAKEKKQPQNEEEDKVVHELFDINGKYWPLMYLLLHIILFLLSFFYIMETVLGKNLIQGKTYEYQHICSIVLIIVNFGIHGVLYDIRVKKQSFSSKLIFLFVILTTSFTFEINTIMLNYCNVIEFNFFKLETLEDWLFFALYILKSSSLLYLIFFIFIGSPFTFYYIYNANDSSLFMNYKLLIIKFQMMWPFLLPKSWALRFYLFLCLVLVIFGRMVAYFYAQKTSELINILTNNDPTIRAATFLKVFATYGALLLLQGNSAFHNGVLYNLRVIAWQPIKNHVIRIISLRIYTHAHSLPLNWFLKKTFDDLGSLINRGGSNVDNILSHTIFNIFIPIFDLFGAIILFVNAMNGPFALILVITFCSYLLFTFFIFKFKIKTQGLSLSTIVKARNIGMDAMINYETVKFCNNEKYEIARYSEALRNYEKASTKETFILSAINIFKNFIVITGFIIACSFCIHDILIKGKRRDDFITFLTYVQQLYPSLAWIAGYIETTNTSLMQIDSILKLLSTKKEDSEEVKYDLNTRKFEKSLKFEDVSYEYDGKEVLRGINFTLRPGQIIGIVGPSGCGKTTIIRLIYGLLEPQEGVITLDGININLYKKNSFRKIISVVPQEIVLLNDSIRNNVNYGNINATYKELNLALEKFGLTKRFAHNKSGIDFEVGERGSLISRAEKQEIAWARAILKGPKILLLDEATNSLDTEMEMKLLEMIKNEKTRYSSVIVTNRASLAMQADEILFLNDGFIISQGSHAELLARCDRYKEFWNNNTS